MLGNQLLSKGQHSPVPLLEAMLFARGASAIAVVLLQKKFASRWIEEGMKGSVPPGSDGWPL